MSEDFDKLWFQRRTGEDKYTYFLLAITASAIAFAVQKTNEAPPQTDEVYNLAPT